MSNFTQTQIVRAADMVEYVMAHDAAIDKKAFSPSTFCLSLAQIELLNLRVKRSGVDLDAQWQSMWDDVDSEITQRRQERAISMKHKNKLARERAEMLRDEKAFA